MTTVPLVTSDWRRSTAEEPIYKVQNRYFEENPTNNVEGSSLILRPGFKHFIEIGSNPPLSLYSQESVFYDNFFTVTKDAVLRVTETGTYDEIISSTDGFKYFTYNNNKGSFTSSLGDIPPYFFIAGDGGLWVVPETLFAVNTLTASGLIENGATISINGVYYRFTTSSVETGTPNGSSGTPYLVDRGIGTAIALANLYYAITLTGTPGVHYSSTVIRNPDVNINTQGASSIGFYTNLGGSLGNGLPVTTSGTSVLSWSASTFTGGGTGWTDNPGYAITLPEDVAGIQAITTLASYVILAVRSSTSELSGRFYWINPGDTYIDPANYATAETFPDLIHSIRTVGDTLWLLGGSSSEVWYPTGDSNLPFSRLKGQAFNTGCLKGTDQVIEDSLIFVDSNYKVRSYSGSSVSVLSDNSIEEQIKRFLIGNVDEFNNRIRTTTFSINGHLFYKIDLGTDTTLLYDFTTKKWSYWSTDGENYLRPNQFVRIKPYPTTYNYIVSDNESGQFWYLDEDYKFDDAPGTEGDEVSLIHTTVTAAIPMRMRNTVKCNELYLSGSKGNPSVNAIFIVDPDSYILSDPYYVLLYEGYVQTISPSVARPISVSLEYSDDNGVTWSNPRYIDIIEDNFNQEIAWRSLGLIKAPGRIFRISDYGALKTIDGLDIR